MSAAAVLLVLVLIVCVLAFWADGDRERVLSGGVVILALALLGGAVLMGLALFVMSVEENCDNGVSRWQCSDSLQTLFALGVPLAIFAACALFLASARD